MFRVVTFMFFTFCCWFIVLIPPRQLDRKTLTAIFCLHATRPHPHQRPRAELLCECVTNISSIAGSSRICHFQQSSFHSTRRIQDNRRAQEWPPVFSTAAEADRISLDRIARLVSLFWVLSLIRMCADAALFPFPVIRVES